jgi:ribosome-binding protein aMBF1 (putative translation factor)
LIRALVGRVERGGAERPGSRLVGVRARSSRLHWLGQVCDRAATLERSAHEQPTRARLNRDVEHPPAEPSHPEFDRRRVDSICPRETSPVAVSNASMLICRRCTSNPATIAPSPRSLPRRRLPPIRPLMERRQCENKPTASGQEPAQMLVGCNGRDGPRRPRTGPDRFHQLVQGAAEHGRAQNRVDGNYERHQAFSSPITRRVGAAIFIKVSLARRASRAQRGRP